MGMVPISELPRRIAIPDNYVSTTERRLPTSACMDQSLRKFGLVTLAAVVFFIAAIIIVLAG
jgi:hypothetical protein